MSAFVISRQNRSNRFSSSMDLNNQDWALVNFHSTNDKTHLRISTPEAYLLTNSFVAIFYESLKHPAVCSLYVLGLVIMLYYG